MTKAEMDMVQRMLVELQMLREDVAEMKSQISSITMQKQMVTLAEACVMLSIGRSTMMEKLKNGEFAFAVKQGKKWLFPVERLREWQQRY